MIVAFHALAGRPETSRVALLFAHAMAKEDEAADVVLVRPFLRDEPALPPSSERPFEVVERSCAGIGAATAAALGEIRRRCGARIVLDLPAACLGRADLYRAADVSVATVGPSPLDEDAAVIGRRPRGELGFWFLGCGRSDGPSAPAALSRNLRKAGIPMPNVLPVALPRAGRSELDRTFAGNPDARDVRWGGRVLTAARSIVGDPVTSRHAVSMRPRTGSPGRFDDWTVEDRLRDLADQLHSIRDGVGPTPADLDGAPLLDDWEPRLRTVPALAGRVHGHPEIPDGNECVTSDLYGTDMTTWARTLSRYYRLGTPREERGTAH